MDKKEAIKELKFEKNISAGVMEQLGTTKALRKIVAIQQKKRTQTFFLFHFPDQLCPPKFRYQV